MIRFLDKICRVDYDNIIAVSLIIFLGFDIYLIIFNIEIDILFYIKFQ